MMDIKLPANYDKMNQLERRMVREEYVRIQHGLCWHCHESLNGNPAKNVMEKSIRKDLFPVSFFKYPVHLHHDHDTGLTIGAVHSYCNAVLWQYHHE
jgi:hypothetical protein